MPKKREQKPARRKRPERRDPPPCIEMRLGIVIGDPDDKDLDGAAQWLIARAGALGGRFRIWQSRSTSQPLENFRDVDVEGGFIHAGSVRHYENPGNGESGYGDVLPDLQNCRGRIVELVIFHHGSPVSESEVGDQLVKIFDAIRVPVCRVVWWACNAAVSLDLAEAHWTDMMMRRLGRHARCRPCGCLHPIELIWPTAGRCHLTGPGANDTPNTNDGNVNRARWGYRWPDGSFNPGPPPTTSTVPALPDVREPAHGQPTQTGGASVLGANVTTH